MQHCYTSVHTSLISSSPPRRLDAAVRPGSCYTCSLAQASLRRRDDRHYWWSQRVICLCRANYGATLACPLQSANAFSLWVLSRRVWMQLQLEHQFWKNVTGARFWKRVSDNRILLNNLSCIALCCTALHYIKSLKRLKPRIALNGKPVAELQSVTCRMGSLSITCQSAPDTSEHARLNPREPGRYSIYLPWRNGRLSRPR